MDTKQNNKKWNRKVSKMILRIKVKEKSGIYLSYGKTCEGMTFDLNKYTKKKVVRL